MVKALPMSYFDFFQGIKLQIQLHLKQNVYMLPSEETCLKYQESNDSPSQIHTGNLSI